MDGVVKKLNRVEGQVRGIRGMCEQKKSCKQILQQIAAAKSALNTVARDLMREEACACIPSQKEQKELDKILKTYFELK